MGGRDSTALFHSSGIGSIAGPSTFSKNGSRASRQISSITVFLDLLIQFRLALDRLREDFVDFFRTGEFEQIVDEGGFRFLLHLFTVHKLTYIKYLLNLRGREKFSCRTFHHSLVTDEISKV